MLMTSPPTAPVRLHNLTPIQKQFKNDWRHRFFMVTAGRRSRKTLIATRKILYKALSTHNGRFFHAAPTWQQARQIFWDHPYNSVAKNTRMWWSRPPRETEPMTIYLVGGSTIEIWSLEKPSRIEGHPWDGWHITEFASIRDCKKVWQSTLEPMTIDTDAFSILDGRPDMHAQGASQYREMAEGYACSGNIPLPEPQTGAFAENGEWCFYSWLSSDVIKPEILEKIKKRADPKFFAQEYEGSFQRLQGQAYYAFIGDHYPAGNIDNSIKYDHTLPVYIGMDFNVDPMTAIVKHHVKITAGENAGQTESHVFAGYHIRNSNTRELMQRIFSEYPGAPYYTLTPCQSARARQTVADIGTTDTTIIENTAREMGKVLYIDSQSRNPLIKDRINLTNARLYHKLIRVNGENEGCKELIRDWSAIGWKEGSGELEMTDPQRGHISAAMDYSEYVHFDLMPINTDTRGVGAIF